MVAGDAVAAVAAHRARSDDEPAVTTGVDLPAKTPGGAPQSGTRGHAEVQVPATGRRRDRQRVARAGLTGLDRECAQDVLAAACAGPPRWRGRAAGGVEVDDEAD